MGVSTDAVLFYGYCWDEEDFDLFEESHAGGDEDMEWPEILLRRRGHKNPWDDFPKEFERLPYEERRKQSDAWTDNHRAEIDAWYAKKRAVEHEFGVEVRHHCSGEYPMPYVCIPDVGLTVARGYPQQLTELIIPKPEWREKLDRFLAEFKIEKPQELPGWWLVSYWG